MKRDGDGMRLALMIKEQVCISEKQKLMLQLFLLIL